MSTQAGSWLRCMAPRPGARRRLVCFPYAGGSSAAYRGWSEGLPHDVEVWSANLPGHAGRLAEPPARDLSALAGSLATAILDAPSLPVALFGHSMGAWLALETHRRMRDNGREPFALIVSGRYAPGAGPDAKPIGDLDDSDFLREVQARYGGVPPEAASSEEIMELILPILREDIRLLESARFEAHPRLSSPIEVFAGSNDPATASRADLEAWAGETTSQTRIHYFDGAHFFIDTAREHVLSTLSDILTS